jgi:hypothetical protein
MAKCDAILFWRSQFLVIGKEREDRRVQIGKPAPTEAEPEAGARWADKLASAARDWAINALAERLALAMISALA